MSKLTIENITCSSEWGNFGCNNINGVVIRDSIINRWDTHCYSKNALFENCRFYDFYTQYSYHVGYIYYRNCELKNYRPFLNDSSFNINKNVQLILEGCVLHDCEKLVSNYVTPADVVRRKLIATDELADLYVKNCVFNNVRDAYLYPFNNHTVIPSNRGTIRFENCKFLGERNVIQFSNTTRSLDIYFDNVDLNPGYQIGRYDEFKSIRINSVDAKVQITNSKLNFYNGISNSENNVVGSIKNSIVYSARFSDFEKDKRFTFDNCDVILDCMDEGENSNVLPYTYFKDCRFLLPPGKDTANVRWFQGGSVYESCTFDEGVTLGEKDVAGFSQHIYMALPLIHVNGTIDGDVYHRMITSGIGGTYRCYVQNHGYKYVLDGVEVSKAEYYGYNNTNN